MVETLGLILAVLVTPASTGDRDAAQDLLAQATRRHHRLRRVWADSGYTDMLAGWCATAVNLILTITAASTTTKASSCCPNGGSWSGPSSRSWACWPNAAPLVGGASY